MKMKNIFSSHIDAVGYHPEAQELHVHYSSGKKAVFDGVPHDIGKAVTEAASVGSAMHEHIRGTYKPRYL